ncbi:MAG TPA: periplasmic heavy metal sensor [Casimicrobiaceae bacterium]|nr:periplasmic heavy metal sensor [Casimicrobiaceae bacterium]
MKRILLAIVSAAVLSGAAVPAFGQVPTPRGHGDPFAVIETLKGSLNLNTSQQQQFDSAVAASQAARQTIRANLIQLKAASQAELAKPEPDLAALAAQADAVQDQNSVARKSARSAWLALYATFTPDQKAVVRNAIQAKMTMMESIRAHLRESLGL